jgi:O-antigen/teichoic acid export membrane protein
MLSRSRIGTLSRVSRARVGVRQLLGSQLRRNMAWSSASSAFSAGVLALSYTTYLHLLGYEKYGLWLVLATVVTFSQIGNLGISQGVAKRVASTPVGQRLEASQRFASTATFMVLLTGTLLLLIVQLFKPLILTALHLSGNNANIVATLLPYTSAFSAYLFVFDISNSVLIGLGRLDQSALVQTLVQVLSLIYTTGFLFSGSGVAGVLAGTALAYFTGHLIQAVLIRRLTGGGIYRSSKVSWEAGRSLITIGGWLLGCTLIGLLMSPLNRWVLARYVSLAAIPIYDIPFSSSMRLKNLFDASQRALIAEVGQAVNSPHPKQRITSLVRRSQKLLLIAVPAFTIIGLGINPILKLWLGSRYTPEMATTFRVLLPGALLASIGVPAYYALIGLGRTSSIFIATFAQTAANVTLLSILVASHAAITATYVSTCTSIAIAVGSLSLVLEFRRPKTWANGETPD